MSRIKIFFKNLFTIRNFILFISSLLLIAAFVLLLVFVVNYHEMSNYKDIALISSSIAVGVIPIAIHIRSRDEKVKSQEWAEHYNALSDIEKIRLLDINSTHLFIRRTLEDFYMYYAANSLCESFLDFRSNISFYESLDQIIVSKPYNIWDILISSIKKCLHFLPNGSQIKDDKLLDKDRLDLFLAMMVNEMEIVDVLCYRYLTMKVDKEMFDKFEKKQIVKMYSYCYYLLVELRINERFKQIDSICAIIKSERETTKK